MTDLYFFSRTCDFSGGRIIFLRNRTKPPIKNRTLGNYGKFLSRPLELPFSSPAIGGRDTEVNETRKNCPCEKTGQEILKHVSRGNIYLVPSLFFAFVNKELRAKNFETISTNRMSLENTLVPFNKTFSFDPRHFPSFL